MQFLFDLGGVFFDWDPKFYYKNIINEPEELDTFLNEICSDEWNFKQDAGRTIEEAENELIVKFPKYESKIKLYYRNHRKMIKGIYLESIEVLNELKLNMPDITYIYSQNSALSLLKFIKIYKMDRLWLDTNLMCIGEKTSSILNEIKWKKIFLFNPGEEEFLLYKI